MALAYGHLSTYPPTQCGLATFTAALNHHIAASAPDVRSRVVRVLGDTEPRLGTGGRRGVAHEMEPGGARTAAAVLDRCDVVVVQHEYGIYSGRDGDDVLAVLDRVRVPVVVVLHTVLTAPTPHQREVLEQVVDRAAAVVTLSWSAQQRLLAGYAVRRPESVVVIPHGALLADRADRTARGGRRPLVLTWGLLSPGKGIEWGISALRELRDLRPRYLVAGQTHPKVLAREGEAYRTGLRERAAAEDVADLVEFSSGYLSAGALAALVSRADVVLLPYDSTEQVTSGVLAEALAAGRPVVATAFPHAAELLADGVGLLVPRHDAAAIASALRRVLTEPGLAGELADRATAAAAGTGWPAVAERYHRLACDVVAARTGVPA
jgi:glycosyltransferase involved in cell wall biosynthesis